jgi:hypothetical protein
MGGEYVNALDWELRSEQMWTMGTRRELEPCNVIRTNRVMRVQ